jgi:hypothetical protein
MTRNFDLAFDLAFSSRARKAWGRLDQLTPLIKVFPTIFPLLLAIGSPEINTSPGTRTHVKLSFDSLNWICFPDPGFVSLNPSFSAFAPKLPSIAASNTSAHRCLIRAFNNGPWGRRPARSRPPLSLCLWSCQDPSDASRRPKSNLLALRKEVYRSQQNKFGVSGSRKSIAALLLLRIYTPTLGRIEINDQDI